MKKDSFLLYADAYDCIRSLPIAKKGELLDAIFLYHREESIPELDPVVEMAFNFLRSGFERDAAKYAERCEKARQSARKRWDANACERTKRNANHADNDPDPDNDPDNDIKESPLSGTLPRCPHKKIVELWNTVLPELPAVTIISDQRKRSLKTRWREEERRQSLDWWKGFFEYIRGCSFLMGVTSNGDRPFELTFDWMLKPSNFVKIIEGNYEDKS